jgi:hypothetical protein
MQEIKFKYLYKFVTKIENIIFDENSSGQKIPHPGAADSSWCL